MAIEGPTPFRIRRSGTVTFFAGGAWLRPLPLLYITTSGSRSAGALPGRSKPGARRSTPAETVAPERPSGKDGIPMAIGMPGLYLARELDDCRPLLTLLTLLTLLSVALFPSASIGLPGPASRAPCPSC